MAGSVNKVILVGNLGTDPEIRRFGDSGNLLAILNIATFDNWRDKNSGERKERTEWHRVVIYNENLAKIVEQYLKKGSKVYLEGQLQTRKWQDQNGNERYRTEIVVQNYRGELHMLDSRKNNNVYQNKYQYKNDKQEKKDFKEFDEENNFARELDDEVPF